MSTKTKKQKTAKPSSRPPAAHHLSTPALPSLPSTSSAAVSLPTPHLHSGPAQQRYTERASLGVSSGVAAHGLAPGDMDIDDLADLAPDPDADPAEASLGERLAAAATNGAPGPPQQPTSTAPDAQRAPAPAPVPVPATSLSRILTQALHSSDTLLLESCLAHRRPQLVLSTVQRLPPHLAVPLLNACVERLGRGARGESGKGGGAAASAERAQGVVEWVRAVLVCHTAYLLTVPEIITRLSGLYALLSTRLALHPRLLTLSGRLDLVLSQLELRETALPAPHAVPGSGKKKAGGAGTKAKVGYKYVEGMSSEEDGEVGVEKADEEGSVEDVELGGSEEDDDDDEEEDGDEGEDVDMEDLEEDEEEDEDDDGDVEDDDEDEDDEEDEEEDEEDDARPNGFVHDEASEADEDEESE